MPASAINQYNVAVLPNPAHFLRSDFARVLTQKFGGQKFAIVGQGTGALGNELRELGANALVYESAGQMAAVSQNGHAITLDLALWLYPKSNGEDEAEIDALTRMAEAIVLLPGAGVEVSKRRPELVEKFRARGFAPDYGWELSEFESGALQLVRRTSEGSASSEAETAIARLNQRVLWLERTLRTRMSELEAADRHIAKLEEKLLGLKEAKKQIKQLKQEKQAFRKSPERKIGQVLLAPYRLPQKLLRKVNKRAAPASPAISERSTAAAKEYQAWLEGHRATPQELEMMRIEAGTFRNAPLISILTPVFNTPAPWLIAAVGSVLAQIYSRWELILIDDASDEVETIAALADLAGRDERIRLLRLQTNSGISAASNEGLAAAKGDWIALLDHDDLLEPDALFQTAKLLQANPEADLVYSDEDKLTEEGFASPLLKPDWSPDFFLSYNYLCHFITVRRSLVTAAGGFRPEFDGAQDYDLLLRVSEKTERIHHIPRVLYHWRRSASSTSDNIRRKPKALEAGKRAIEEHLQRRGESAHVVIDWRTHAYWVKREVVETQKIAVIIPVRDGIALLQRCIDTLVNKTSYPDYEIVIVNNDSESEEARDYFARTPHRVLSYSGPFNYSAINNFAVEQTDAPWLLFLNNDVEIIESEWLNLMAEHVQRPAVGAVGARLLFPDETVQHGGVVVGVGGVAQHAFRGFPAEDPGVARQLQVIRNYSAVTGACLLTRRAVFEEVGGFDEEKLPVTFNDVDLCLKMRRAGYRIVYTPFAKLYHHESATRRPSPEARESDVMRTRWAEAMARDPYYNPNLSRAKADYSLGK